MAKDKGSRVVIDDASDDVAIRVSNVSKSFRLPHNRQSSIKGSLVNLIGGGDRSYETQEVLKDISFEIKKGEFFGIVGRNGSGKSTLLKMLAGIYKPTAGQITVNGSLTPFIELGVGFNPELTGRENVYMNGALLGFNDKEVTAMYDDIVSFAELERFMDQKLKNYSSGMQVRLAFSIAIRARSDILLIDEVLAVGDADFQQKCYQYFDDLKESDKTIILVSHDMGAVKQFCDRAILISNGELTKNGPSESVALEYEKLNLLKATSSPNVQENKEKKLVNITTSQNGKVSGSVQSGAEFTIGIKWDKSLDVRNVGVIFYKGQEVVFATNSLNIKDFIHAGQFSCEAFVKANLGNGRYKVRVGLFGPGGRRDPLGLFGNKSLTVFGSAAKNQNNDDIEGIIELPVQWKQH